MRQVSVPSVALPGAIFILVAAVSITASAAERQPNQTSAGEALALGLCAGCHMVAPNQSNPPMLTPAPKSFQQIADDPSTTAAGVRRFITTTHWDSRTLPMTMPEPHLLDEEADQVSTYILGLRKGPAQPKAPRAKVTRSDRNVEHGEYIALTICSYCHVVSSDARYRPSLDQATPSFQEIAANPKVTAASLRRFVTTTHWDNKTLPMTMPDPMLEPQGTADVVRYILSMRNQR